jgi:lipoteichoic acid synthase
LNVFSSFGSLLSRRDWVYALSLLVPFVLYDLALRTASMSSQPGLASSLNLMWSNVFFVLGYALLWVGLFTATGKGGLLRRAVVVSFHAITMLVVIVSTCAYQYFQETGATLDYSIIALWLPELKEVGPVLTGSVPALVWIVLSVALLYTALGPWFLTSTVERRRGWPRLSLGRTPEISFSASVGLWLLALGFCSISLLISLSAIGASKSFARDPFINVVLTGFEETTAEEANSEVLTAEHPAAHASLVQTPRTEKRNVVLIHLESTRAGATTLYNSDLETTPFLNELAKSSLFAERDYTIVPHTSKASVSVNCGIEPHLVQPTTEANPDGIPTPCLADLLKEQGYGTVFFQSSTQDFENFDGLVENFGYEEYYPLESLDTEGFQRMNYFGYEDDIMLKPSKEWLREHENEPFIAEYLLGTGHHDYECLGTSHGDKGFSEDNLINSYLNCMRLQDIFLKNLIDQYKELGLYDNTIFVIYGDHGEGFGEHGRFQHDDTIWEEGLQVPLLIHAPGLIGGDGRVEELSNHADILPTVLELLGYEVKGGEYPGYSLLHQLPEDRTLMFSCFHQDACLASLKGSEKYVYHYDNQPDELFDLSKDHLEKNNLARERPKEEVDKRRKDLLEWRSRVNAKYEGRTVDHRDESQEEGSQKEGTPS